MALEELRSGDESQRPQLEAGAAEFLSDARRDRSAARDAVSEIRRSCAGERDRQAGSARDPRRAEPPALHRESDSRRGRAASGLTGRARLCGNYFKSISARTAQIEDCRHRPRHDEQPGRLHGPDRAREFSRMRKGARLFRASFRSTNDGRLIAGEPARETAADASGAHCLLGEAADGPRRCRRSGRAEAVSVSHCRGDSESVIRLQLGDRTFHAARDLGRGSAAIERECRSSRWASR